MQRFSDGYRTAGSRLSGISQSTSGIPVWYQHVTSPAALAFQLSRGRPLRGSGPRRGLPSRAPSRIVPGGRRRMRASVRARPFSRDITLPRIPICRRTAALPTKDQVEPSARGRVKAGLGALPPTRFPARVCIRVRYSGLHPQKGILSPCRDGGIPSPTVRQFRGIHPSCAATVTGPWGKTRGYREISPLSCRSCSSRCSRRCWYSSTLDQNFPRTHNRSVPRSRYNTARTSEPDHSRCSTG